MIYTMRSDIRRAILSKGFLAGVIGIVAVIALTSVTGILKTFANSPLLPSSYHALIVVNALPSDPVVLAMPIICTLPFTPAFVDDMQSGFIKQFLPRTGINAYIWGKLAACAIAGGFVLFSGIVLTYVLSTLVFMPLETTFTEGGVVGTSFMLLLGKAAVFFFSGMFWSLVGLTVAGVTQSKYMAYASPFIFYYILIILYERYFGTFYYLYPKEWLNPSQIWGQGNWGLILFLTLLTLAISVVFTIFARRKLGNG
ncbi:MAG TPA: hypothetical protein VGL94_02930 [Ktedonobacteraceae bacterium]